MHRRQALRLSLGTLGALAFGCAETTPAARPAAYPAPRPPLPLPRSHLAPTARTVPPEPPPDPELFAELKDFCAGVPPVSDDELKARRDAAQRALAKNDIGALVCEASVCLRYLAGVRWGQSERPLLFVLPVEGEPIWVAPAFEANTLKERTGQARVELWQEHETPYALAARALGQRRTGRVALDPAMRLFVADGLRSALPAARVAKTLFEDLRIVKTPLELERLRRVNLATKAAIAAASRHVKAGMAEADFAALLRQAQMAAGLENVWVLALFGPNAAFPHGTKNPRALEPRDGILVDTGGSLYGYCSDISRTWVFGEPTPAFARAWQTVLEAQTAALAAVKPGAIPNAVDAAARTVLKDAGFGGDYERFTHRTGHGIGLEVHEAPYLVRGNARPLGPGMTMSDEPGIYVPGEFGVRIEDILAVTESGAEVFGPRPIALDKPFG